MKELWYTPVPYFLLALWVAGQVLPARDGNWMEAAIVAWSGIGVLAFIACLVLAYRAGASE